MRVFIANFGLANYLWPRCLSDSSILKVEDEDAWLLWVANDREAYINLCIGQKRTAKGIPPTRPVASRWFNLNAILYDTEGDIWIHREKDELWWTISLPDEPSVAQEFAPDGARAGRRVCVLQKPAREWSNEDRKGRRLRWNGLHPKAREFLFTEGTIQKLSEDYAAYASALIEGGGYEVWHTRTAWKQKAKAAKHSAVTTLAARERAIADMATTARSTVAGARGQEVARRVKTKELRFDNPQQLEDYIGKLLDAQEELCAITGLRLQYPGDHDDAQLLCSLDRIDSSGHYERGNLQIVCRFVNRWKSDQSDEEFRRLMRLVREAGGFE